MANASCDVEEWRPAVGWEGYYSVSTLGRVRTELNRGKGKAGNILKPSLLKNGYLMVNLYRDGTRTAKCIHNIVAETFIGPRPWKYETMHIDGNKLNNTLGNLRYGTNRENHLDVHRHGGRLGSQILSLQQVSEIRVRLASGESQRGIARSLGCSRRTVYDIKTGRTWSHRLDQTLLQNQES